MTDLSLPSAQSFSRSKPAMIALPLLAAGLVGIYAFWLMIFKMPVTADVSWLIVTGHRLLDGEKLTVDLMEVNPPASVWLYLPFVVMERISGIRAEIWTALAVIGIGLASITMSWRMLARADGIYAGPLAIPMIALTAFVTLVLFPTEIGQREQWALIAFLPWLALQLVRQRSADFSAPSKKAIVIAGLCAGLMVIVKPPHFALAMIIPALALAISRRSIKPLFVPENLIGAAMAAAYAGLIIFTQPDFITTVLPFVRELYLPIRRPLEDMIFDWPATVVILSFSACLIVGNPRRLHWDARLLLLASFGFMLAYLIMGKGWPNHAWPMIALAILGFGAQLLRSPRLFSQPLPRMVAAVFGCVVSMNSLYALHKFALQDLAPGTERLAGAIASLTPRPTIVSLSPYLQTAHPLARDTGGTFISRYPAAWPIEKADILAQNASDPAEGTRLTAVRDELIGEFSREIETRQPDVVLYSNRSGERWDEIMLGDDRIQRALLHYRPAKVERDVTVYVRTVARHRQWPATQ